MFLESLQRRVSVILNFPFIILIELIYISKMSRYCCVPKCLNNNKNKKCFHIPTTKDVQKVWLQRINNSEVGYSSRIDLYVVCEEHFYQECVGSNKKLKKFSLPTLNLPDYCPDPEKKDIFLTKPSTFTNQPSDREEYSSRAQALNSKLEDSPKSLTVLVPKRVYSRRKDILSVRESFGSEEKQ